MKLIAQLIALFLASFTMAVDEKSLQVSFENQALIEENCQDEATDIGRLLSNYLTLEESSHLRRQLWPSECGTCCNYRRELEEPIVATNSTFGTGLPIAECAGLMAKTNNALNSVATVVSPGCQTALLQKREFACYEKP